MGVDDLLVVIIDWQWLDLLASSMNDSLIKRLPSLLFLPSSNCIDTIHGTLLTYHIPLQPFVQIPLKQTSMQNHSENQSTGKRSDSMTIPHSSKNPWT